MSHSDDKMENTDYYMYTTYYQSDCSMVFTESPKKVWFAQESKWGLLPGIRKSFPHNNAYLAFAQGVCLVDRDKCIHQPFMTNPLMVMTATLSRQRRLSPWQPKKGGKGGWGRETRELQNHLRIRLCVPYPTYPHDVHVLIPGTCECYGTAHTADKIQPRILRWGDYPGWSGWALNAITGVLLRGRKRETGHTQRRGQHEDRGRTWSDALWAKECRQPPEAGGSKKLIFPSSIWWNREPAKTLILAQWN